MLDATTDPIRQLRDVLGTFCTGVCVVTYRTPDGEATGMTVNSFSSLSLDPPLVLFSVGLDQPSAACFEAGADFTVNILADAMSDAAWACATPAKDKLKGLEMTEGENALPRLSGALGHLECEVRNVADGGDHALIIGRVLCHDANEGDPLLFFRGEMREVAPCETKAEARN